MSFSNDSNNQASSFFDDQNNEGSFQFAVPGSNKPRDLSLLPLYVVSMTVKYQTANGEISGLFGLQGSIIVKYEVFIFEKCVVIVE